MSVRTDEEHLLLQLKGGDSQAFRSIYDRYKDRLGHSLLRLMKSEELAEEVLQDIFLKIWEHRTSIDPSRPFKSYLFRIAENRVYDLFRRATKEAEILKEIIAANSELYTHVEEGLIEKENTAFLERLLSQLPNQRKRVFTACKLEEKSYQEVADELGISVNTVNDHVQKAMQYLRAHVHQDSALYFLILLAGLFSEK